MPSKKLIGMPRAKKGEKFLVIKEGGKDQYIVASLKKKKR